MAEKTGQVEDVTQDGGTGEKAAVQTDIEEEARKVGWQPESAWVGAPPKNGFVDAQTFLERGETIAPILSARLKGSQEALESLRILSAKANKFMADANARALEKRDWVLVELENILEKAAVAEDRTAFARATRKIYDLESGSAAVKQHLSISVQQFLRDNEWYSTDPDLRAFADEYAEILNESGISEKAMLEKVAHRTREVFTHIFNERRSTTPVEIPNWRAPSPKPKRYEDLPGTAKAACDAFIADEIMTEAEYVKNYKWD